VPWGITCALRLDLLNMASQSELPGVVRSPLYRGRFAPSPTGPLHFGSLVAALASYLESRSHQGEWLLRVDDLDQTRCVPGMDKHIMDTLEAFGFQWDGAPAYQSRTTRDYQAALDTLIRQGHIYYCRCSRKQVAAAAVRVGDEGPVYPGTCRELGLSDGPGRAARIVADHDIITFEDGLFGHQSQNLAQDVGDFVVRRADGLFAYQLAVVVDDQRNAINHVVRGADLLSSTPRQIWLQRLLGYPRPRYLHIPLVYASDGKKLSKSDAAHPVDSGRPVASLLDAWHFLQQDMPDSRDMSLSEFWQWAPSKWDVLNIQVKRNHD